MKYDYWFARQLVVITGIILIVQLLTEVVGTHNILKDGEVIKSGDTLLMNIRTYTDFKARCEPFLP